MIQIVSGNDDFFSVEGSDVIIGLDYTSDDIRALHIDVVVVAGDRKGTLVGHIFPRVRSVGGKCGRDVLSLRISDFRTLGINRHRGIRELRSSTVLCLRGLDRDIVSNLGLASVDINHSSVLLHQETGIRGSHDNGGTDFKESVILCRQRLSDSSFRRFFARTGLIAA